VPTSLTTPVLDRDLLPGYAELAVIADVEYHRCGVSSCPNNSSTTRAALTATLGRNGLRKRARSPKGGNGAPGVNYAAIPLYTIVTVRPGCTHIHTEVTTTHVSGDVGAVKGAATTLLT
jgi:hypothetical protein